MAERTRTGWVNAHNSPRGTPGVLHASPATPVPCATGGGYEAVCTLRVRQVTTVPWTPVGAIRRCQDCRAGVEAADAWA